MPKYQLIIGSDNPNDLAAHFSIMMGGTSGIANQVAAIGLSHVNDTDDNAPPNPNAPQFDAAGIPWDDRIHSKNKGMTNDGMWRKKRGVADTTVAAVEMELKARGAQPMYMPPPNAPPAYSPPPQGYAPPPNAFNPPPPPNAFNPPPPPNAFNPPPQGYAPPPPQGYAPPPQGYAPPPNAPPPNAPPVGAPPPALVVGMDFAQFMQHVSAQLPKRDANNNPIMDGNYLASVAQRLSSQTGRPFSVITDLANNPDCITLAVQIIQGDGRW